MLKSTDMGHIDKSFIYETMKPFMTSGLIVANGSETVPSIILFT